MDWIATATWPKVFKLRCGAGSSNVKLVRSRSEAEAFCTTAFNRGFPSEMVRMDTVQKYVRAGAVSKGPSSSVWDVWREKHFFAPSAATKIPGSAVIFISRNSCRTIISIFA